MAPKGTTKGKQPAVQEGSFLQFLRSVGYKEELPPSTVAYLDTAPVFKFLASKLTKDNFVSAEDQQEYNEIMLAKGPNAELYDALGNSSDDEEEEQDQQTGEDEHWMGEAASIDMQRQIQAKEQYVHSLEQQISSLKSLSGQLDSSTAAQRARQPLYMSLQASANHQLAAAKSEASKLNAELNSVLVGLSQVCCELGGLAQEQPEQWLLSAADLGVYGEQDEAARQLFDRAMRLLNAAGVVRQLDAAASPAPHTSAVATPAASPAGKQPPEAAATPHKAAAAAAAAGAAGFPSALMTPRQQKVAAAAAAAQQQSPLLTPRGRGKSNREEALLDADIRRHADQEARNAALLRELTRQRLAFKLALDELIRAEVAEAGVKGQLAAARDVRAGAGGFARLKKVGPDAVCQLSAEVCGLEERRQLLGSEEVPALTEDLARLNDTYIVAGDYDRQLHKMSVASERKQAVLTSLLDVTSRHLLLLLLGAQERQRLTGLAGELAATQQQVEGHVEGSRTRINKVVAAQHALQQSQQRSNLQPDDSYLLALMAAAQGSLALEGAGEGSSAEEAAVVAGSSNNSDSAPATPLGSGAAGALGTPRSARTPSYVPVKHLADQLQQLSAGLQQSSSQLQQLLRNLPQQLERHHSAAHQLHNLAFPPGQHNAPIVQQSGAGAGSISGWCGTSSVAGSAAPSVRSMRSTSSSTATASSGMGQHPLPALRVPEVAEAQSALEGCCRQLGSDVNKLVHKHNELAKMMNSHKHEQEVERGVMHMFFTMPEELPHIVEKLKGEVEALELARVLDQD